MVKPAGQRTAAIIAAPAVRLQGLTPCVTPHTQWLLLGSFPGLASLQAQQYYGHPRNQFWRLLGTVMRLPLAEADYATRLALLREHDIGLWDVITETERAGSLDADIRDPLASDLHGLLARLPRLHTIAFNGGTAARLGLRQLGKLAQRYRVLSLPSSSPAYTLGFEQKLAAWQQLLTS
ncbi:DNA-deoxyinosine glycosylase [Paucibacter sp. APW11]|uniref:DNA-deoxyinosine glycosylase n=1 Tax=Roseateles aquae TaxID=3077235 RepID=A0ABU3PD58_9BURK|nr:DNA-deoxyinosine glycosylase [Paucibacter sp. APW11]MDT9000527.1 DNA-deoxyinosine glycosylase [Paucibacter sp. APW11]